MIPFNKRTIIGNRKCVKDLNNFKNLVRTYFKNTREEAYEDDLIENDRAKEFRSLINQQLHPIHEIIRASGISTVVTYTPPPMIGGLVQRIDLVTNIFNLHRYQITSQDLIDFIDRSIGVYENDKIKAIIRTINPLFWFVRLLDFFISIPIRFLASLGFDAEKVSDSPAIKIFKAMVYIAGAASSAIGLVQFFKTL